MIARNSVGLTEVSKAFRPVAPPQLIDEAYSADQHARLLSVVREHGPWPLILAENFKTPEEVIATSAAPASPSKVASPPI